VSESPSNKKVWKFPYCCYKQQKPKLPRPNILHEYSSPSFFEKQKLFKDTEQDLVVRNTILAITGTYELICGDDIPFFHLTERRYICVHTHTHTLHIRSMVQTVVKSDKRMWNKSQIYKIYRTRIKKYYKSFKSKIQMSQKKSITNSKQ